MTSVIFNSIGLSGIDPAILFIALLVLFLIAIVLNIVLFTKFSKLNKTYNKFMDGKNGRSLEAEVMSVFDDIRFLKRSNRNINDEIKCIKENLRFTYQKLGIIKYDAFGKMGGKLSFSIAMLNDRDDGYIINSVHSTEGCYMYVKEIEDGKSAIALGDEEKAALDMALSSQTASVNTKDMSDEQEMEIVVNQDRNPLKAREVTVDLQPIDLEELGFEEV